MFCIHFVTHTLTHILQLVHFSKSIMARLSFIVMAADGHFLTHIPQLIQPLVHFFLVIAPFSVLLHKTKTGVWISSTEIKLFGQALTHKPQPVQSFLLITAREFSKQTASLGQTVLQSP